MDLTLAGYLGLAVFLFLVLTGTSIGLAAALLGLVGLWWVAGADPALTALGTLPFSIASSYTFTVIPLFIMMGHFSYHVGFAEDAYRVGRLWVGRLPGGLASATSVAGGALGATCGSSLAASSILVKVALPELEKCGYDQKLAAGCIASVGTLAAVIPPSALIVIYGIMTEESVGKLLIAGLVPGFIIAVLFIAQITLRAWRNPRLGPPIYGVTWKERFGSLPGMWGMALVALLIVGGIYGGVFTPTEAGAAGAAAALLIGLLRRRLKWKNLGEALLETGRTTAMIFIVIVGVLIFVRFIAYTRVTYDIGEFIVALPVAPVVILIGMLALYLVLGMFIDAVGMLMLTLPIFSPATQALGLDPIWFGILVILMCEIGVLTPPVGLNVYVVKSLAPHVPLENIFWGVTPFILTMFVVIALIIAFPDIVLFLPNTMIK